MTEVGNGMFRRLSLLSGLALVMSFASVHPARIQAQDAKLSDKQAKNPIANAKTPADHARLADFYRSKAAESKAAAAEHEGMLQAYSQYPDAKQMGVSGADCRDLIRFDNEEAEKYLALAEDHEHMGKSL